MNLFNIKKALYNDYAINIYKKRSRTKEKLKDQLMYIQNHNDKIKHS